MTIRLILAAGVVALSVTACSPADDAEKDAMSAESNAADAAAMVPADGSMPANGAMAPSDGSMNPGTTQSGSMRPGSTQPGTIPNNPPPVDGSMPLPGNPANNGMTTSPPPA